MLRLRSDKKNRKQLFLSSKLVLFFYCCLFCLKFMGFGWAQEKKVSKKRPNILFIMSDDHSSNAISAYGGRLAEIAPTPNIDRLAQEGMRMDNVFCTNAICTPSRATILTGQYSHINGVYTLEDDFDSKADNVAKQLQKSGYTTAMVGKWHLHNEPSGFDYYNVLPNQGRYFDPILKEKGKPWKNRKKGGEVYKGYATDVITDIALKWLDKQSNEKPFFMMLHHKAPHGLWQYDKRHKELFKGIKIPEPESLYNDGDHGPVKGEKYGSSISNRNIERSMLYQVTTSIGKKKWPTGIIDTVGLTSREKTSAAYQKYLKDYLKTVAAIDENVGRVLKYLDENDLTDNTIVIYTSDQGQFLGEHDYFDKRWMYEESLRMPFLIRYPEKIKAGSTNKDIITNVDFAPTFLDIAEVEAPSSMQGKSFKNIYEGRTPKDWQKSMYYHYWMHMSAHDNPGHYGIRTGRYKLIFFYGLALGKKGAYNVATTPYWELYDLKADPEEMNNLYAKPEYKELIRELKKSLLAKKKEVEDTDDQYPELMELRKKHWND